MLLAIGIYKDHEHSNPTRFEKIKGAQKDKLSLFSSDQLSELEKISLPELPIPLENHHVYSIKSGNEHHYVTRALNGMIYALVSRVALDEKEMRYLFININHVYTRPENVKISLDDIIMNPLGFTGTNKQINKIQEDIQETKIVMINTIDKILNRGENLGILQAKTLDLAKNGKEFNEKATALNNRCCKS